MIAILKLVMDFHLLPFFALFCLVLKGSNGSQVAEVYWKSMLPNTPLPKALKDLLQPEGKMTFSYPDNDLPQEFSMAAFEVRYFVTYDGGYWPDKRKFNKDVILNSTTVFFLYDDLHPDKQMKLIFTKSANGSNFLPHRVAESILFSSNKLREILSYFSIKPTSKKAQIMKQTIEECEAPNIRGEDKHCATSLEFLVDFVIAKFGNKVKTISNEVEEENTKQEYTILKEVKMIGENHIVCHKERYAYAVYYCHKINGTKVYEVPFRGSDGSKAKAVVVCHTDTSAWSPNHFAFQVLKIKPGGPPICHLLYSDTIVWIPN